MRRLTLRLVLAVCVVVPVLPAGATHADESAAQKAAREIADARDHANAASDAYFQAESRLDSLTVEQQLLQGQIDGLQGQVTALEVRVQQVAVNRFTSSSSAGSPILNGFDSPEQHMQIEALSAVISDTSETQFDDFAAVHHDMETKQGVLRRSEQQTAQLRTKMADLRETALSQVKHLQQVEAQRLKDNAVRVALAAENQRRADKAAAERAQHAEAQARARRAPTTGGGGNGGQVSAPRNTDWGNVSWVCPTGTAAVGFSDTWGAPRSGGRHHEGVDMIGTRGTPVLAVVGGLAQAKTNVLGGNTVWFIGDDGNSYYYAHLDSWVNLGQVHKGDVIGLLGQTGNAQFSTPHLHFEIHPGHGAAVDPYPTVRAHC